MAYSLNHNLNVGDIVRSMGDQVAITDKYEVWQQRDYEGVGTYVTVGEATIRITSGAAKVIDTNWGRKIGVVCFLPVEFRGKAIIAVRITKIHAKSVEALPIDYLEAEKPFDWIYHGFTASAILKDVPTAKRVLNHENKN